VASCFNGVFLLLAFSRGIPLAARLAFLSPRGSPARRDAAALPLAYRDRSSLAPILLA
jgi:hypothetical protein